MPTNQLTQNSRLEDWLSARAESPATRHSYVDHWNILVQFCSARGKDPNTIVDGFRAARLQGEQQKEMFLEEWQDLIRAFTSYLKGKYVSMSFAVRLSILKSYFKFWKIPLEVTLPRRTYVTYHNRDLQKSEIKKILSNASLRDRAIFLMLLESGMRVGSCASLKYWQIKEDYEQSRVPMRISLPSAVLKDKVGDRFTFIGVDGFKALQDYLQTRPPLKKDDDYVFESERAAKEGAIPERSLAQSISTKFNRLVQKLGIDHSVGKGKPKQIRLHGLRKYFFNNMKADSDYKRFWMGHSLGVEQHYISREIEEHRKKYGEGYKFVRIYETIESNIDLHQQIRERDEQLRQLSERMEKLSPLLRMMEDPKAREDLKLYSAAYLETDDSQKAEEAKKQGKSYERRVVLDLTDEQIAKVNEVTNRLDIDISKALQKALNLTIDDLMKKSATKKSKKAEKNEAVSHSDQ